MGTNRFRQKENEERRWNKMKMAKRLLNLSRPPQKKALPHARRVLFWLG